MKLKGKDTFKVLRILKKMEVSKVLKENQEEALELFEKFQKEDDRAKIQSMLGMSIIADIIIDKIELVEEEIFDLLENNTDKTLDQLYQLEMAELINLIMELVTENMGFLKKVLK